MRLQPSAMGGSLDILHSAPGILLSLKDVAILPDSLHILTRQSAASPAKTRDNAGN
jgi:hypothetical protein